MSVVVGYQNTANVNISYMACVKGSPEVLKAMLIDAPPDYDEAYLQMARRGARVLALGQKPLGDLSHQQVRLNNRLSGELGNSSGSLSPFTRVTLSLSLSLSLS
ncbi:unnamed protein product, partial [Dibothriocephalus latus]